MAPIEITSKFLFYLRIKLPENLYYVDTMLIYMYMYNYVEGVYSKLTM